MKNKDDLKNENDPRIQENTILSKGSPQANKP